eukprot:3070790-Pyramimonas_sp.AAC.1
MGSSSWMTDRSQMSRPILFVTTCGSHLNSIKLLVSSSVKERQVRHASDDPLPLEEHLWATCRSTDA